MKKVLFILIFLSCLFLTGCCTTDSIIQQEWQENSKDHITCIDGIEYITFEDGYRGYMAPHLTTDKFNNAKVIECEAKNEN